MLKNSSALGPSVAPQSLSVAKGYLMLIRYMPDACLWGPSCTRRAG